MALGARTGKTRDRIEGKFEMKPLRAFFVSFFLALAVLFSGHGIVNFMLADTPEVRAEGARIPTA